MFGNMTRETKAWTQFTTKDGLGDDCAYALAFDQQGRLWAGHLNHGVSVYNGVKWQNYGLIDGPLGDRVFAIAVSPRMAMSGSQRTWVSRVTRKRGRIGITTRGHPGFRRIKSRP